MAQFANMYEVDLNNRSYPVSLVQTVSEGNVYANRIGAYVYKDGAPVNLGGACTGLVMRADGTTVPLTGYVEGNAAYVVLDQPSCAIPGPIQVAVNSVVGENITTLLVAYGTVILTDTRNYVEPGTPIPDITELLAEIDNMREATAEAEAAATKAVRYDETQSLTDAQKGQGRANIDAAFSNSLPINGLYALEWTNNILYLGQDGTRHYEPARIGMAKINTATHDLYITCKSGYSFAVGKYTGTDESQLESISNTGWINGKKYLIHVGDNFYINLKRNDGANISISECDNVLFVDYADTTVTDIVEKINKQVKKTRALSEYMFEYGTAYVSNDTVHYEDTNACVRLILDTTISLDIGDYIISQNGYQYRLIRLSDNGSAVQTKSFDENDVTIGVNARFIIVIRKSDNSVITDIGLAVNSIVIGNKQIFGSFIVYDMLQQGGLTADGLNDGYNLLRLRTPDYIPIESGAKYKISTRPKSGTANVSMSVSFYGVDDFVTPRIGYVPFIDSNEIIIYPPNGSAFMRILIRYSGNTNIQPVEIDSMVIEKFSENKFDNYAVSSNFAKQKIGLELIGNLPSGTQSFIIYNNNYYSLDGSGVLTVQNSTFDLVDTKSILVGHANGFQLGNNNRAYISGWDDNTIYILDLITLDIVGTINLPTTGYTTCAVDDVNMIAYIFQRSTYPSTQDIYTFIVYDYANEEIIKTKTLPVKFSAMQACDFFEGRIIVANGGGDVDMPNGFRIYDTDGNVISNYILGSFATSEPEGVFVDRTNMNIYICFYGKPLFMLSNGQ